MKSPSSFRHVTATGSTNQDLLASLRSGADPLPLLADHQRDGRGRLGRRWHDDPPSLGPAQSMLGSIPQRWDPEDRRLPLVPLAVGLAAVAALDELDLHPPVRLWWPNDLVVAVDGRWRKLAGILVETAAIQGDPRIGVVVGVGLNLSPVGRDADPDVVRRAISVAELMKGTPPTNRHVFSRLVDCVATATTRLRDNAAGLVADYRAACATIGETVEVHTTGGILSGLAAGVSDSGSLLLDGRTGRATVTVGDVVARGN